MVITMKTGPALSSREFRLGADGKSLNSHVAGIRLLSEINALLVVIGGHQLVASLASSGHRSGIKLHSASDPTSWARPNLSGQDLIIIAKTNQSKTKD